MFYLLYALSIGIFALNDAGEMSYNADIFSFIRFFSGQTYLFWGFAAWLYLMHLFIRITKNNFTTYTVLITLVITDLLFALVPTLYNYLPESTAKEVQGVFQNSANILFAINLLFIIVTNISRISNKEKLAIFYAIANIPVVIGTLIYYSNYYNITDIQFGVLNPVALGLCIETFVLAFGFGYRFNLMAKEKTKLLVQINEQQDETTKQIIATQENERKRIAEDLHDRLGSNLAAIKLNIQKLPIDKHLYSPIIRMLDDTSMEVRNISHNLMPPAFSKTKLADLLSSHYKQLSSESNIIFSFHCLGYDQQFNKEDELMIYRIIMELTNNAIRHSEATESTIQLLYKDTQLEIMVEDNGNGFIEKNTRELD